MPTTQPEVQYCTTFKKGGKPLTPIIVSGKPYVSVPELIDVLEKCSRKAVIDFLKKEVLPLSGKPKLSIKSYWVSINNAPVLMVRFKGQDYFKLKDVAQALGGQEKGKLYAKRLNREGESHYLAKFKCRDLSWETWFITLKGIDVLAPTIRAWKKLNQPLEIKNLKGGSHD